MDDVVARACQNRIRVLDSLWGMWAGVNRVWEIKIRSGDEEIDRLHSCLLAVRPLGAGGCLL